MTVNARSLALQILREQRTNQLFASDLLDDHLGRAGLSSADARLTTHLVYGVIRRRRTLDVLIRPFVTRGLDRVEDWLLDALRLGAYQLAMLTTIPPHAAVHATVELATEQRRPQAKGFLNGVLRRISELVTADTTDVPSATALPLEAGVFRTLSKPVLPDPALMPAAYLAEGCSLPDWLVDRWLSRDDFVRCLRRGVWFAGTVPLWLRVNPLRTTRESLVAALAAEGHIVEVGPTPQAIGLPAGASVRKLHGYTEGWFTVQDATAQRVALALAPEPGWRVLDLCAAPGGKATHLAELMGDRGEVIACDPDESRLAMLAGLSRRLGLKSVRPTLVGGEPPPGPFDAVLVDAPCSNTGVLGRRPEVRWRLQPREFPYLVELQERLLRSALNRVRPGGLVVYSTCSGEPDENEQLVRRIPGVRIESEQTWSAGEPADGGYCARLRAEM